VSERARDGSAAEGLAAKLLDDAGLRVLARNYRCRGGEIDLVALDGDTLVFVEVRLRRDARFGGPGASIDTRKQARIVLAAQHYLMGAPTNMRDRPCRFDAILLDGLDDARMQWLKNAFDA